MRINFGRLGESGERHTRELLQTGQGDTSHIQNIEIESIAIFDCYKVRVETPNLLSSGKFTTFNVSWNRGYLCVRQGGAHGPVLIDGKDCVNYTVRYLGVRTAWGSTGSWKIRVGGLPSGKGIPST